MVAVLYSFSYKFEPFELTVVFVESGLYEPSRYEKFLMIVSFSFTMSSKFPLTREETLTFAEIFNVSFALISIFLEERAICPVSPSFAGVKVCRQATGTWVNEWEAHDHPRGCKWWWLTGEFEVQDNDPSADRVALSNNYVTITPTTIDFTDYRLLADMQEWKF